MVTDLPLVTHVAHGHRAGGVCPRVDRIMTSHHGIEKVAEALSAASPWFHVHQADRASGLNTV